MDNHPVTIFKGFKAGGYGRHTVHVCNSGARIFRLFAGPLDYWHLEKYNGTGDDFEKPMSVRTWLAPPSLERCEFASSLNGTVFAWSMPIVNDVRIVCEVNDHPDLVVDDFEFDDNLSMVGKFLAVSPDGDQVAVSAFNGNVFEVLLLNVSVEDQEVYLAARYTSAVLHKLQGMVFGYDGLHLLVQSPQNNVSITSLRPDEGAFELVGNVPVNFGTKLRSIVAFQNFDYGLDEGLMVIAEELFDKTRAYSVHLFRGDRAEYEFEGTAGLDFSCISGGEHPPKIRAAHISDHANSLLLGVHLQAPEHKAGEEGIVYKVDNILDYIKGKAPIQGSYSVRKSTDRPRPHCYGAGITASADHRRVVVTSLNSLGGLQDREDFWVYTKEPATEDELWEDVNCKLNGKEETPSNDQESKMNYAILNNNTKAGYEGLPTVALCWEGKTLLQTYDGPDGWTLEGRQFGPTDDPESLLFRKVFDDCRPGFDRDNIAVAGTGAVVGDQIKNKVFLLHFTGVTYSQYEAHVPRKGIAFAGEHVAMAGSGKYAAVSRYHNGTNKMLGSSVAIYPVNGKVEKDGKIHSIDDFGFEKGTHVRGISFGKNDRLLYVLLEKEKDQTLIVACLRMADDGEITAEEGSVTLPKHKYSMIVAGFQSYAEGVMVAVSGGRDSKGKSYILLITHAHGSADAYNLEVSRDFKVSNKLNLVNAVISYDGYSIMASTVEDMPTDHAIYYVDLLEHKGKKKLNFEEFAGPDCSEFTDGDRVQARLTADASIGNFVVMYDDLDCPSSGVTVIPGSRDVFDDLDGEEDDECDPDCEGLCSVCAPPATMPRKASKPKKSEKIRVLITNTITEEVLVEVDKALYEETHGAASPSSAIEAVMDGGEVVIRNMSSSHAIEQVEPK